MLGALWTQIWSSYPKHQITGLDLFPTQQGGGAAFEKVYNPGGWISFSQRPVFESGAQVVQNNSRFLPGACQPVPPNEYDAEIRTHVGYNFFLPRVE